MARLVRAIFIFKFMLDDNGITSENPKQTLFSPLHESIKAMKNLKVKNPFFLLGNPLTENMLSEEAYFEAAFNFIAREPDNTFEDRLAKLLERKRFAALFNFTTRVVEEFGVKPHLKTRASLMRIWKFYKCVLLKNYEGISAFVKIRNKVELALLTGNYTIAEALLERFQSDFGESLWYIRSKVLLLSYQGRSHELQEFCSRLKERAPDKLFRYIINCFQLITDSDDASLRLKNLVQTYVDEFSEGKQASAASLLSLLFVPAPLKGQAPYIDSLESIQIFPLVDQYVALLQWLEYAVSDSLLNEKLLFPGLSGVLGALSEKIDDPILANLYKASIGQAYTSMSEQGREIFNEYNRGNYLEVISGFYGNLDTLADPLAYLNIVAKANAYSPGRADEVSSKTIMQRFIHDLTAIYNLDPNRKQAEDSVVSTIIKLRSFSQFAQLQLAFYKALPILHCRDDLRQAARLVIISGLETTPLVGAIAKSADSDFAIDLGLLGDESPNYRKLKRQICEASMDNAEEVSNVEKALEDLQECTPLKKDFLELYSLFCLRCDKINELLSLSASTLCMDSNTYICFPMERLIEEIENRRIGSVEAVIVAFYYLRNISNKKEYVLNEAFEEYILSQSAVKPSEILIRLSQLDALQTKFFKDICAPEVMDFLDCFKSTNELRAERVRILDLLMERNLIDSSTRMREVEKIVGQVIVDAGTSEFNRAKIFVDETAVLKQHLDELTSLFAIYHQARDEGDDRITLLDKSDKSGETTTYVSGGKNSIVLRIYNILREGFLYDEMHGFDKNLSTEIRHGFFSNLMRARLQEQNLITEIDETGQYKPNVYWENANSFLISRVWNAIDEHLKEFSEAFNKLVAEAEEWMKIGDGMSSSRMFDYPFNLAEFRALKQVMNEAVDVTQVASFVMHMMWVHTEASLAKIRERINVDFRDRVDALFEKLSDDIIETKKMSAAVTLMAAINHARDGIKEDITTVAEWFQRDKSPGMEGRLLNYVVEIAISSFEKVKGSGFAIEKDISTDLRQIKISSKAVRSFIIAITNLLDNCYRRSGLGQETRVEIHAFPIDKGAEIRITNNISEEKSKILSNEVIREIDKKMRAPDSIDFMRTEGGSGLSKAYNEIASLSSASDLRLSYNETHFSAIITYEI